MGKWFSNWKFWVVLSVMGLMIALGAIGMYKWQVEPLRAERAELEEKLLYSQKRGEQLEKLLGITQKAKDETRVQTITETETYINYIEKEIDSSGQKEKTDVDLSISQPKINVAVNGKPFEVPMIAGETYAFENGKLVLKQTSAVTVDIKMPEPKKKSWRLGAYTEWGTDKNNPDVGARLNRQWKKVDGDLYINQDKDVKLQGTWWVN